MIRLRWYRIAILTADGTDVDFVVYALSPSRTLAMLRAREEYPEAFGRALLLAPLRSAPSIARDAKKDLRAARAQLATRRAVNA